MKNFLIFLAAGWFLLAQNGFAATQDAYCIVPPYVAQNVKPNINLVLDFSGSMQFSSYQDCSGNLWGGYNSSNVALCYGGSSSNIATDQSFKYNTTESYYGYWKNSVYYKYNTSTAQFEENSACTNTDNIGNSTSCISGNLLNWLFTTRVDALRKILTGGKLYSTTTDTLVSEGANFNFQDQTLHCTFKVKASSTPDTRQLTIANQSSSNACVLGTGSSMNARVKTTTPADITGVVQTVYPSMADLELIVFNTTVGSKYRVGKNSSSGVSAYVSAINSELAYNGTPTGEALTESKYFFQQDSSKISSTNSSLVSKASATYDPYYDFSGTSSIPVPCRKSFNLLISDGAWNGSIDPVTPAFSMRTADQRTDTDLTTMQNVTTYAVYIAAGDDSDNGREAMITTAIFGGFTDLDGNGYPYPYTSKPTSSLTQTFPLSQCNYNSTTGTGTWNTGCNEWGDNTTNLPYNFFEGADGAQLAAAINNAVISILGRTSSGTAASIIGNTDNNGALLTQAFYFPLKTFSSGSQVSWIGELEALWYYIDPQLQNITIREDTDLDQKLNLKNDRIASFAFDGTQTTVNLYTDTNGNGALDSSESTATVSGESIDDVNALWKAGRTLWTRDLTASPRTIYVNDPTAASPAGSMLSFNTSLATATLLQPYMDVSTVSDATNVINFTLGNTVTGYRNRGVKIGTVTNNWKLGDIINSSPKLLTANELNNYDQVAPYSYSDSSYSKFVNSKNYQQRGLALVGANDGMLHAFKLGRNFTASGSYVSQIKNPDGTVISDLGKELWGFIPKNVLPYLKNMGNTAYKHLYYVDSTPLLFDAAIGQTKYYDGLNTITCDSGTGTSKPYYQCVKQTTQTTLSGSKYFSTDISGSVSTSQKTLGTSWRSVLIGSMGLGGATRIMNDSCINCVKTPITDPVTSTSGFGYSSFFALDLTNATSPQLLWEFSDPKLGYSTASPAIIRIKDPNETNPTDTTQKIARNGRWYAILASGPTGPIDTASEQMKGYSDQPLVIFVLDLKTGQVVRTFGPKGTSTNNTEFSLPNAFAGSLLNASLDTEKYNQGTPLPGIYSDDAVYIGYTRLDTVASSPSYNKYSKGGVLRILTNNDPDPANWKISTVIDGVGPVTTAVAKLQKYDSAKQNGQLWLFFGTGRYYYKIGNTIDEDYSGQQEAIYGIWDKCLTPTTNNFSDPTNCTTSSSPTNLQDQTTTISTSIGSKDGWVIKLDQANSSYFAKRIITDPTTSSTGTVFFTAFKPSTDVCGYGGRTSLWAVKYNSGAAASAGLVGQAVLQLSTGAFQQINLSGAFTQSGGRETPSFAGVPPKQATPVISNSNSFPSKKILHIQEH